MCWRYRKNDIYLALFLCAAQGILKLSLRARLITAWLNHRLPNPSSEQDAALRFIRFVSRQDVEC